MAKSNSLLKWKLDFHAKTKDPVRYSSGGGGGQLAACSSQTMALCSDVSLNPPGFCPGAGYAQETATQDDDHRLMLKRSWDIALGPLKQVPMNLFIMYMAGSSISIFPIMMVGMMFVRPAKALVSLNAAFGSLDDGTGRRLIGQKFMYILGNLVGICLALYKCYSMGLLPTHQSDWLAFIEPQNRAEFSFGGHAFQ